MHQALSTHRDDGMVRGDPETDDDDDTERVSNTKPNLVSNVTTSPCAAESASTAFTTKLREESPKSRAALRCRRVDIPEIFNFIIRGRRRIRCAIFLVRVVVFVIVFAP